MTERPAAPRPQQVTTAVVLAVTGCLLTLANLFSVRDELNGTTVQQGLQDAEKQAQGVGLSAAAMTDVLHGLVYVSGALTAAVTVLAVYAWRRHRGAWLALFVLAALMVLTLPV